MMFSFVLGMHEEVISGFYHIEKQKPSFLDEKQLDRQSPKKY